MNRVIRRGPLAALLLILALSSALIAVACGGDDDDDDDGGSTPAASDGTNLRDLTISGQWVRTTTNDVTAAYLVVKNAGAADTLVKVTSPLTTNVQLHEVITEGSSSKMQEKPGGFPVPANGMLELKPGGFHIMMLDVEKPVTEGQEVSLTLTFETAGDVTIVAVAKPGSDSGMDEGMDDTMATATPAK